MTDLLPPRHTAARSQHRVGYAVMGAGTRSSHLMRHVSSHHDRLAFRGIYDPASQRAADAVARFGDDDSRTYSHREALLADPAVDWVLVISPNHQHKQDIIAALEAGKHVFVEKPLATTLDDCIEIYDAHRRRPDQALATGFVLRYTPLYRKVKQLLDDKAIGDIISISATENIPPAHGGHIMTCWRRYAEQSGSHMLEKCCHDMDLLLWFVGSLPTTVASFGGNDMFVPEREHLLHHFTPPPGAKSVYLEWNTPTRDVQNPFTAEKTIIDNQVAILQFKNAVRVMFQTTMNNAIPERRMYISGTEGTLVADLYAKTVQVRRIGHDEPLTQWAYPDGGGHGGGDGVIMDELAETMAAGAPVTCGGLEGLRSAVVSLAIEQARQEMRVVDLHATWQRLGLLG